MTKEQKKRIRAMRLQAAGYGTIAKELDLKPDKVEEYCQAHGLGGDGRLVRLNYPIWCEKTGHCPRCGVKLIQPKTGRKKRFCSGKCRDAYYRMEQKSGEVETLTFEEYDGLVFAKWDL